jgi:hypothetical protein
MNFESNVNGMTTCWKDQANATTATATLVLPQRTRKRDTRWPS